MATRSTPGGTLTYNQDESRISRLTLLFGALASVSVAFFRGGHWGFGILIGSVLAWLNFRWLRQGLDAFTEAATAQANQRNVNVPVLTYFKALFRYGLIALAVYGIFRYLNVPVLSIVLGLCALGAATFVVSIHSIVYPQE
ncbi:MAG TPA: ATP synthase subunit I [Candidatus Acidoferrum sp.]|jgi:small-conductance mechanosensitive channel|nr:ATP synthase subunit I [Candidatus Acidoferrum sp.]